MPLEAASGLWRSEDMVMLQLHMQREAAHDSVLKLGQVGKFQFVDLNKDVSAFQRDFAPEVRRCDDMERKMKFLLEEIQKEKVLVVENGLAETETMHTLEHKLEQCEGDVREMKEQFDALLDERNRCREHLEVLNRDFGGTSANPGGLCLLTGVVPKDKLPILERLLYRTTRGNSVMRTNEVEDPFYNPATEEHICKSVFAVWFYAPRLRDRIVKIFEVNGASLYNYAENQEQLEKMRHSLRTQVETVEQTLQYTANERRRALAKIARTCFEWRRSIVTEKAVYASMNMMHFSGSTVVCRGWAPVRFVEDIRRALLDAEHSSGAQVSTVVEEFRTKDMRPTYFNTNKITESFQGIVDSYGMARYKEVNPGVFTIITFPYLFGIMYGDIGHGIILTVFAVFLILMEKRWEGKPLNEIFEMIFGGRYLLFFMGLFATYMGLLYNDMFGFSVELFNTGYTWPPLPPNGPSGLVTPTNLKEGNMKPDSSCYFGVDAAWSETENKLEFYNSIKMKSAVIIGIVQMTAGIILSLFNHLYYQDKLHVWFRFIPEIVFLTCTFGYMSIIIVVKWCTTWTDYSVAPSLLETMTNFFLAPGSISMPLYPGQAFIQVVLLLIAVVMVPALLCVIPYMENKQHKEKLASRAARQNLVEEPMDEGEEEEEDEFDFSEVVIHSIIHTIEYVLGCVSNTASYLRLWALSLAHSQLSEVFWNFAFMTTVGMDGGSGILIFFGFAIWMMATLGVLLGMESLSAFLHALRLHWVEFNNKFYYADGMPFTPLDIPRLISELH